ncbi:FadR/GntR family transcriptional regulator [Sulfitobacter pontiacus]|jgi:DNA-binding FadR family transcriptional regulator|uniref:FadR/GntR family transcriptional regulator n=1 Tax=Sulfitobacter pontiacus TaxID=60137 RepID=UPI000C49E67E|nr:FCD domain-containing protein [Sulfitobacter pontiacus]MAB16505.1 GntR family transcriptional regulator [Roseobacter sp.]HCI98406.1 FadR family transcriptional regulator [Sulfitobacter sp.]HJO52571.1 GntR family transcriptional regulator [Sulfitobacter pontiacus]|tara:strand:- start:1090 stop:1833 length:744 start_codon:yes stop_codon:yes gene_type:complete
MNSTPETVSDLSSHIAANIRDAIIKGVLIVDERLPSEAELSAQFNVSRATVREALKRLAAQSLIRTQRGATGGAFVNRISFEAAQAQQITTSTLLLSMNDVSFETACEARFALERACAPLSAARRQDHHLDAMQNALAAQSAPDLSDAGFCAADVAFHRALVDGACNPVLSYQLAGAVEAMQPLMNMITFTAWSRDAIVARHRDIAAAIAARDAGAAAQGLSLLEEETQALARTVFARRSKQIDAAR